MDILAAPMSLACSPARDVRVRLPLGGVTRSGAVAADLSADCSARHFRLGCSALNLRLERLSGQRDFTPSRVPMVWCITEREEVI